MYTKTLAFLLALALLVGGGAFVTDVANIAPHFQKGGSPGNWTGTYAPVMNATEDVFVLLGDISSLLSYYSGTLTVLAITMVIVGIMGMAPLAFGIGIFLWAFNYGKDKYKSYRR